MTLSIERINKARSAGYDDAQIIDSISKRDPDFGQRISKARESGYDNTTIMQSIEKRIASNTPKAIKQPKSESNIEPKYEEKQQDLLKSFKSGLSQSASGELANFQGKSEQELVEDPTF